MCAIDWSLIGMKQFLHAIHQPSEKRIDIHCKVTFGFKYISFVSIPRVEQQMICKYDQIFTNPCGH